MVETFALAAVIAERVLGLRMFDVQILGALALQRGHIAEMQTGEGKTLAAVPAVVWYALSGRGVHVLTANDYLARRDARWMGGIYEWFGFPSAHVSQNMAAERAPRRIPVRRHLRHRERGGLRLSARRAGACRRTNWCSGRSPLR